MLGHKLQRRALENILFLKDNFFVSVVLFHDGLRQRLFLTSLALNKKKGLGENTSVVANKERKRELARKRQAEKGV